MHVLPDSSMVPAENILDSPPNNFSHRVPKAQPYYFQHARKAASPDGHFAAGAQLLLLSRHAGELCRVADAKGLSAFTEYATLEPLQINPVATKKKKFDARKEVRAIARERVGTVKPSKVIVPKQQRPKPKHKTSPMEDEL